MKRKILILITVLFLYKCSKEEDDLYSINCTSNCTEVTGKVLTNMGKVPISNLKLNIKWDNIPYLGSGVIRNKAETFTDQDGNFRLKFFARNDEMNAGNFRVEYEINNDEFYSPSYNYISQFQIEKRDTILNYNYNIPKKAFINLTFKNIEVAENNDRITTNFTFEKIIGFKQPISGRGISWSKNSKKINLIEVVGNQNIFVEIRKIIDNNTIVETDTINIEAGKSFNYNIDFKN